MYDALPSGPNHLWEMAEVEALLDRGDDLIASNRDDRADHAPIMAMLAPAMERVAKLTIALANSETSVRRTRQLVELDRHCRQNMRDNATTIYLGQLLDDLDADPLLGGMLDAFNYYVNAGRYHFLDAVRDGPDTGESPFERWDALLVTAAGSEWGSFGGKVLLDGDVTDRLERAQNDMLRRSLFRWRRTYYLHWLNGTCGPTAKQLAPYLDPCHGSRPPAPGFSLDPPF